MKKTYGFFLVVSVFCCSFLMAGEHVKKKKAMIGEQFIGVWVEKEEDGKKLGQITVLESHITWVRRGLDPEIVKPEDIMISGDDKTLMFSSEVLVVQGIPKSAAQPDGKALVVLSIDQGDLVVEISGMREKVKRCGAVPKKGCAGITRKIVDEKMITCIKYAPEIHRYRKFE